MADDRKTLCNGRQNPKKLKNKVPKPKFYIKSYELITLYTNTKATNFKNDNKTVHHRTENPCGDTNKNSIIAHEKKKTTNLVKYRVYKHNKQKLLDHVYSSRNSREGYQHYSLPDIQSRDNKKAKFIVRGSDIILQKSSHPFRQEYIVNMISEYNIPNSLNLYKKPITKARWEIYRCQFNAREEGCCCCCNSDAMFDVMKSLYDCYKKKNCDHCDCILCGHLPKEERRVNEMRKSTMNMETACQKITPSEKAARLITPLEGKTPKQKENILRSMAMAGIPLPEEKTKSEKKIINRIRKDVGLPPEPKTAAERYKYNKAFAAGIISPLEDKTPRQKEKILTAQYNAGIPLPKGRTRSEKSLIAKIKACPQHNAGLPLPVGRTPSEKSLIAKIKTGPCGICTPSTYAYERHRQAEAAGFVTPLTGKTPEQKENIVRGLATHGLPLPEGKTPSEKKLIDKVRKDVGLPPEPKTAAEKNKYDKALAAGIVTPLEGKSLAKQEKILKALAMNGISLPEGKTCAEKKLIDKVRNDVGLPPEPKTAEDNARYNKGMAEGIVTPLQGKTPAQKEKILRAQHNAGLPLPVGRTPSEKSLIAKIKADPCGICTPSSCVYERHGQAEAAGFGTPLTDKTPEQKENIVRGLATHGLPLPEGKTPSEKKLIDKVRKEVGLPPEPKTAAEKNKYDKALAAGIVTPLEGKSLAKQEKILKTLAMNGISLPEGKTCAEKKLIGKVRNDVGLPPEPKTAEDNARYNKGMAEGIVTPLQGKTPAQKEKILRAQHNAGLPLPVGRTPSEKSLIAKIKAGPCGIYTPSTCAYEKHRQAETNGFVTPLTGKTPEQKENIVRELATHGLPLPEGKTPSEKKLIDKVRKDVGLPPEPKTAAEKNKYDKALAAGIVTPLEGKSLAKQEKILKALAMNGILLPEGKTCAEKKLIGKVRNDVGLPPEPKTAEDNARYNKAMAEGIVTPLQGKTPAQKEKILRAQHNAGLPLPVERTPSEKSLIAKIKAGSCGICTPSTYAYERHRQAEAAGFVTPLTGKTPEQKENIVRGLATHGLPLPEGKTPSEKKLIDKVRKDVGLPPEPKTAAEKNKYDKALAAGIVTPLEGKSLAKKEKILKALAMNGIPLPEGKTCAEKKLINKVRNDVGLPPEPKTAEDNARYNKAMAEGIVTPLQGKTPAQKEKILRAQHYAGLLLPVGRTASEKSMIANIKAGLSGICTPSTCAYKKHRQAEAAIPSQKLQKSISAGLFTPLQGKTLEQIEKLLRGLAMNNIPLPKGKTPCEKKIIDKVRADLGLPPEPKTARQQDKYNKAAADGLITPLEGKTAAQKEKILKAQYDAGIPLPEGRTPSEKSLIDKITEWFCTIPLEKAGLLTPLKGKRPTEKENIVRGLAEAGLPLPHANTASEKSLVQKVRAEYGIPLEAITPSEIIIVKKARAQGLLTPLKGKTPLEKEKIVRGLAEAKFPIPEGTTPSEKAIIKKVQSEIGLPADPTPPEKKCKIRARYKKPELGLAIEAVTPSEKEIVRRAKAEGLITPLTGKTPEQKEKIVKGLVAAGLPIPEGKTSSERVLVQKTRADLGLLPEPTSSEIRGFCRRKSKRVGAAEEFQDIKKITTCDRGCGCDKKKIKFKHSYVKIIITSPDISSFCPCAKKCGRLPGVRHEVFTDNEGIKITVGNAVGTPTYSKEPQIGNITLQFNDQENNLSLYETNEGARKTDPVVDKTVKYLSDNKSYFTNLSDCNLSSLIVLHEKKVFKTISSQSLVGSSFEVERNTNQNENSSTSHFHDIPTLLSFYSIAAITSSISGLDSVLLIKTESSVSLTSASSIEDATLSIVSIVRSLFSFKSSYNLISDPDMACKSELISTRFTTDSLGSLPKGIVEESEAKIVKSFDRGVLIFRLTKTEFSKTGSSRSCSQVPHDKAPTVVISDLCSDHNTMNVVNNILSKTTVSEDSSIFLLVPTDENDSESSYDGADSTICIQVPQSICKWKKQDFCGNDLTKPTISTGLTITRRGRINKCVSESKSCIDLVRSAPRKSLKFETYSEYREKNTATLKPVINSHNIGVDTIQDRPCSCALRKPTAAEGIMSQCSTIMSEILTPMIAEESIAQGFYEKHYGYYTSRNLRTLKSSMDLKDINVGSRQPPIKLSIVKIPFRKPRKCTQETQVSTVSPLQDTSTACCQCTSDKIKEIITQLNKVMTSTDCGGTSCTNIPKQPYRPPPTAEIQNQEINTEKQMPAEIQDQEVNTEKQMPAEIQNQEVNTEKQMPAEIQNQEINTEKQMPAEFENQEMNTEIQTKTETCTCTETPTNVAIQNKTKCTGSAPPPNNFWCRKPRRQKDRKCRPCCVDENCCCPETPSPPRAKIQNQEINTKKRTPAEFQNHKINTETQTTFTSTETPTPVVIRNKTKRTGSAPPLNNCLSPCECRKPRRQEDEKQTCRTCSVDEGCYCHGKKKRNCTCPCEVYFPNSSKKEEEKKEDESDKKKEKTMKFKNNNSCNCCICASGSAVKGKKCKCPKTSCIKGKIGKYNSEPGRCDYGTEPPELMLNEDILQNMIEDQKKIKLEEELKMKSDMTQTTSGFRVKLKKKTPNVMSLEEAIKYYEEHPEEIPESNVDKGNGCICKDETNLKKSKRKFSMYKKKKKVDCPCPVDETEAAQCAEKTDEETETALSLTANEQPLRGIRIYVGGKGSGSKGFSRVCCYDMLQEQTNFQNSTATSDVSQ